jgi:hypothetical protein
MPSSALAAGGFAVCGGWLLVERPDVELPEPGPDGEIYLNTKQAAAAARVAPCTITRWRSLGYLERLPGCSSRKHLYARSAVLDAERLAWQAAIEASGTDVQIRRRHAA